MGTAGGVMAASPYLSVDTRERTCAVQRLTNEERVAAGLRPKGPARDPTDPVARQAVREARRISRQARVERELRGEGGSARRERYVHLTNAERVALGMRPTGRRPQKVRSMPLSAAVVARAQATPTPFLLPALGAALPKAVTAPLLLLPPTPVAQFAADIYSILQKWDDLFAADRAALLNVNGGHGT